ncbi:hypothetical protein IWQ60_007059 [Tieghemiomyces parasiticus]|uniref:Uncharacterized protein n=1 Tax=Tieghemiomyces parasiticus TaxID=78921 RepID=A0A9W8A9E2_9FUNG|nr:hypothetical protein IWQ60_007059 [Tieghemiomyces parasiticus]
MVLRFLLYVLTPVLLGSLPSFYMKHQVNTWYKTLRKPWFTPPNWLFAPAWTLLYLAMGYAAYRVANVAYLSPDDIARDTGGLTYMSERAQVALKIYWFQLVLNLIWTPIFFLAHAIAPALFDIALLDVFVLVTMTLFFQIDSVAGYLLVPYQLWSLYATALTYSVWSLNNDGVGAKSDQRRRRRSSNMEPVPSHIHDSSDSD